MKVLGIIPARYASTRFPGKPLVNIHGKSMIRRVYEQARKSELLTDLLVATDDERIYDHVLSFEGKAILTSPLHQSGTERCAEVLSRSVEKWDFVINIQGDEPFVQPEQIDSLIREMVQMPDWNVGTLAVLIKNEDSIFNPNHIKVVFDNFKQALYFSRAPLPYLRDQPRESWIRARCHFKHIGMYLYRASNLQDLAGLAQGKLEKAESLEQLRWMENGYRIGVKLTNIETPSIDTPADLQSVLKKMNGDEWS